MESMRSIEVVQKDIEACFSELAALVPADLTEGEVVDCMQRAQRIRSMADAACVRATGALDASKAWAADGARSATAWIAWQCHTSRARATAALSCARSLRHMPRTEAAMLAGLVTTDHVRLLALAQATAPEASPQMGRSVSSVPPRCCGSSSSRQPSAIGGTCTRPTMSRARPPDGATSAMSIALAPSRGWS